MKKGQIFLKQKIEKGMRAFKLQQQYDEWVFFGLMHPYKDADQFLQSSVWFICGVVF